MSIALTVEFLYSWPLQAGTYYVSNGGSDTSSGTSVASPWKTINHAAQTMRAGDVCNIVGGTYRETGTVANTGSSGAPITFQPYNSATVLIDGADIVTGTWAPDPTQINTYCVPLTLTLGQGNQVFLNGVMQSEARLPAPGSTYPWQNSSVNPSPDWFYITGSATYNSNGQNGQFVSSDVPLGNPDKYANCILNIMAGYGWCMTSSTITNSAISSSPPGTLLITSDTNGNKSGEASGAYTLSGGNEFYITGEKFLLSANNEWFYESGKLYMYSSIGTPTGTVEVKQRPYGMDISGKSYITIKGLHFFGCTINSGTGSPHATLDGLVMKYTGHSSQNTNAKTALCLYDGSVLRNSDISFDSFGLVSILGNDVRVINNNLHDSGYIPGLSYLPSDLPGFRAPQWPTMLMAARWTTYRTLISHNTFKNSGRALIGYMGKGAVLEYNKLQNGMILTTDGGDIYTNGDGGNTTIHHNIICDSQGPVGHLGSNTVVGLYLDFESSNWIIHHNLIWYIPMAMELNLRHSFIQVFNNSFHSTPVSIYSYFNSDGDTGSHVFNNILESALGGVGWQYLNTGYNFVGNALYADALNDNFALKSTSPVIASGVVISGITDGYTGTAPSIGAINYGTPDWSASCGYSTVPPSPDPVYVAPYLTTSNEVVDGGFESGALAPNWSGSGPVSIYQNVGGSTSDVTLRTGYCDALCATGTSEITQTVTGLKPNSWYTFYAGINTSVSGTNKPMVALKVQNYGGSLAQTNVAPLSAPAWHMCCLSFHTGTANTSAQIVVSATVPSGAPPVYVDDLGVELNGPLDGLP